MKEGSRANALLVELLLVILFFMLGSTVLVQLFADARHKSIQARETSASLTEAQNCAEELYGEKNPYIWLAENGYTAEGGKWVLRHDEYTLYVTEETEETEGGTLRTFYVSAVADGTDLFTLPSTRYLPKEVDP